jgi:hypothetical protein
MLAFTDDGAVAILLKPIGPATSEATVVVLASRAGVPPEARPGRQHDDARARGLWERLRGDVRAPRGAPRRHRLR